MMSSDINHMKRSAKVSCQNNNRSTAKNINNTFAITLELPIFKRFKFLNILFNIELAAAAATPTPAAIVDAVPATLEVVEVADGEVFEEVCETVLVVCKLHAYLFRVYPELQVDHLLLSLERQTPQLLTLHDFTYRVTPTL